MTVELATLADGAVMLRVYKKVATKNNSEALPEHGTAREKAG